MGVQRRPSQWAANGLVVSPTATYPTTHPSEGESNEMPSTPPPTWAACAQIDPSHRKRSLPDVAHTSVADPAATAGPVAAVTATKKVPSSPETSLMRYLIRA